jgi:hypothetical protein
VSPYNGYPDEPEDEREVRQAWEAEEWPDELPQGYRAAWENWPEEECGPEYWLLKGMAEADNEPPKKKRRGRRGQ